MHKHNIAWEWETFQQWNFSSEYKRSSNEALPKQRRDAEFWLILKRSWQNFIYNFLVNVCKKTNWLVKRIVCTYSLYGRLKDHRECIIFYDYSQVFYNTFFVFVVHIQIKRQKLRTQMLKICIPEPRQHCKTENCFFFLQKISVSFLEGSKKFIK